ncbi:MAG: aldo/keto reductase [Sphingomonadales bacterium]|nr:aldo/keto reductase [Sphingomonadales bacterium]
MTRLRKLAGKDLNPIGLGCMGLTHGYGVPPARDDAAKVLLAALDLGYDHFDTANIYGAGRCEALIGDTLAHRRKDFFLASKTGILFDGPKRGTDCHPDSILKSLDASLARLKTDHLDLFYLHRFDYTVPIADSVGALVRAQEAGKILAYGVSEWSADHIREAHAVHPMAAVQTEYSLWTRNVELAVLETTRELGIALVAFSPLGRGALADGIRDTSTLLENDIRYPHPRFDAENWPKNLALIDRFNAIAAQNGVTPAQLSLAWVLSRGDHVHAIPGTTRLDHLAGNVAKADWQPEAALLEQVDRLINQNTVSGPRYHAPMQKTIDTEEFAPAGA